MIGTLAQGTRHQASLPDIRKSLNILVGQAHFVTTANDKEKNAFITLTQGLVKDCTIYTVKVVRGLKARADSAKENGLNVWQDASKTCISNPGTNANKAFFIFLEILNVYARVFIT